MKDFKHYLVFAELFRYPGENHIASALAAQALVDERYPEIAAELQIFTNYAVSHSAVECQTLYTKTFDVQPMCYLDLGYVIFGEDYKRGAFLLHMQEEQRKAGNDCGSDLSDNIGNILVMYNKSKDAALLDELAVKIMIPGIEKMIAEFEKARVDLKIKVLKKLHKTVIEEEMNHDNVYKNLLVSLLHIFRQDFKDVQPFEALPSEINIEHHNSFFSKENINEFITKQAQSIEIENLVNINKLD